MNGTQKLGPYLKDLRIEKRITLRDLASRVGIDPGNYSRVERGIFAPPSREKVAAILELLQVPMDEREALLDQSDVERGELPSDLLDDQVLVRELPVLFRAMRRGDQGALDKFIEAVRESGSA